MSPREDRRRRVLRDDAPQSATPIEPRKPRGSGDRYTDAARYAQLPRWIDVIPKRMLWICFWFTLGLASLSAIVGASLLRDRYLGSWPIEATSLLELTGYGTLAQWWCSVSLLVAGGLAAMIFSIRCHRVDDYKGRYRQWAVTSLVCVLASVAWATPIHRLGTYAAVQLTGYDFAGHPALWWLLPWSLVATWIGWRAFWDMRASKLACGVLCLAAGVYLGSALIHLGLVDTDRFDLQAWLPVAVMAAHYLWGWSLALYARYVYLDAQGQLVRKVRKRSAGKRKSSESKAAATAARQTEASDSETADEERPVRKRKLKRRSESRPAAMAEDEDPSDEEMSLDELELLTNPDLTRGERRKLKKKLRQQRKAA